jgi:hypothetical protein
MLNFSISKFEVLLFSSSLVQFIERVDNFFFEFTKFFQRINEYFRGEVISTDNAESEPNPSSDLRKKLNFFEERTSFKWPAGRRTRWLWRPPGPFTREFFLNFGFMNC